ncbi:MAG: hypothetical protein ABJN26_01715 [Stappiaceae bacterium]
MGTLLSIDAYRRSIPVRTGPVGKNSQMTGNAQIIIFPGVRIERMEVDLGARIRNVSRTSGKTARPKN